MQTALSRAVLICLALAAPSLSAHPISIIVSQALVHRDRMEMKFAVMPEDFMFFCGLNPNGNSRFGTNEIASAAERYKTLLLERLIVRDADGNRLEGKMVKIEMPTLPKEGLGMTDLMATTIVYRVEYPLAKPPAQLTFQQHLSGDAIAIPAIMYLVVTREGLPPEPTVRITSDENVETIAFDWNETARSAPGNQAAAKRREAEEGNQQLGLASYWTTYTFVYIQNEEVRVEILMPLLALEMWHPVARTNARFIEVSEQLAAAGLLKTFFTGQNELTIDGAVVKPQLHRLDFYGLDFQDLRALRGGPRRLSTLAAHVGVVLTYSTKGAPRHVELKWTLFNQQMQAARAVIFAYDKGSRFTFYPRAPIFKWDNPGAPSLPAVTAISTGEKSHAVIAESLLRNVYRAFDYHSESDIYDALARSAQGDLLAELYLKIKQGLIMQEQGGAVARVREVKVVKTEPAEAKAKNGFAVRVTWRVEGTVEHWGHIHTRVNEYCADLEIAPDGGSWKITAMNVSRQSQVQSAVILRRL